MFKVIAALIAGYLLANISAIALSWLLPGPPADAVMAGLLLSFLVYAVFILWVFRAASFRQAMAWLHAWAGLLMAWLLYFMFLTGSLAYFDDEIDRWMQPEIPAANSTDDQSQLLQLAEQRLQQRAPEAPHWFVNFPVGRYPYLLIEWQEAPDPQRGEKGAWREERLNPNTGQPLSARATGGGQTLYRLHYALHGMPRVLAYLLSSAAALLMLVALISGIIIHKKIFTEFFTLRRGKHQRSWLDLHNLMSVLPLPFHLMITYSGLVLLMFTTMPGAVSARYGVGEQDQARFFAEAFAETPPLEAAGTPANTISLQALLADIRQPVSHKPLAFIGIENRGDRNAQITVSQLDYKGLSAAPVLTYSGVSGELQHRGASQELGAAMQLYQLLINLHEGQFAGPLLRGLYFLSGLLGAGMVATGSILWTLKRRRAAAKKGAKKAAGTRHLVLLERLNLGVIVGVPIAIAGYFWANRLLPLGLSGRAHWELNTLFITLSLALCYALYRPSPRAWVEMLSAAALCYSLLPLANLLLTERHLGISLPQGDWVMAGVDLSLLLAGVLFALAAHLVNSRVENCR